MVDEEAFLKEGAFMKIIDRPITSRARATLPSMLQVFKVLENDVGKLNSFGSKCSS